MRFIKFTYYPTLQGTSNLGGRDEIHKVYLLSNITRDIKPRRKR
jgi:hypothetical protein